MPRVRVLNNEPRFDKHFRQALFAEVFRDKILFAMPRAEGSRRVFREKAVDRDCEFSARLKDAKAFVEGRLRAAEVLKAANTDCAVKGCVLKTKIFGVAVYVIGASSMQLLRRMHGVRIGFEPVGIVEILGEPFRPEPVAAADVQ